MRPSFRFRDRSSRVAAVVVAIEGGSGFAAGVGFAVASLVADPGDRATGVLLGVLLALYGAAILLVARGVDRRRGWARTPAFLTQFFALVVAWYQRGSLPAVTGVLVVVVLVAVASLVASQRQQPG